MEKKSEKMFTRQQILVAFGGTVNPNEIGYNEKASKEYDAIRFEIAIDAISKRKDIELIIISKQLWIEIRPNYEILTNEEGHPFIKPRLDNKLIVQPFGQMPNHLMLIIGEGFMTAWKLDITNNNISSINLGLEVDSDLAEVDLAVTDTDALKEYPKTDKMEVYKAINQYPAQSDKPLYKEGDYFYSTPFTPVGSVISAFDLESMNHEVYVSLSMEPFATDLKPVGSVPLKDSKLAPQIRKILAMRKDALVKEMADLKKEQEHKQGIFDHYVYLASNNLI